jgi:L-lactate dehydrogenase complex protein LldF
MSAIDNTHFQVASPKLEEWQLSVELAKNQFIDLDLARSRASRLRDQVIHELGEHLKQFETEFVHAGGRVIWAPEKEDAQKAVLEIIEKNQAEVIVKTHSTEAYELGLNEVIRSLGNTVYETDYGDFTVDLTGKMPSHPRIPDLHISPEDSLRMLTERLNLPPGTDSDTALKHWRDLMRKKHVNAGVSIVGADFLISKTGSLVLSSREDNVLLSVLKSPVLIVLAGIEKFIPSINDLGLFLSLLGTHAYGQRFPERCQVLTGNGRDPDAPRREVIVILVDNGRTKVLADEKMRPILKCIHCGACSNVCPVFKTLGGHAYANHYPGPFGSIFEAHRLGLKKFAHLSKASTLCGECTRICPVNIDIQRLLIHTRRMAVEEKLVSPKESFGFKLYARIMKEGGRVDKYPKALRRYLMSWLKKDGGSQDPVMREHFAEQSFRQLWEKRKG